MRSQTIKSNDFHQARRSEFRTYLSLILSAFLLFSAFAAFFPMQAQAEDDVTLKTVRVSMDDSGIFITKNADGAPISGYAYEYIQSIAAYAGWRVEYVPVDGFSGAVQAITDGSVDLAYDVSYDADRTAWCLYPDTPMGSEDYYLYCLAGDTGLHSDDPASLNGKTVGVTAGVRQNDDLTAWCEQNGIVLKFREFVSIPEKEAALEAGEIDLDYEISMLANHNYSAIEKIASDDYYLVATAGRPDLIKDINTALKKIKEVNPFFLENLTQKFFSHSVVSSTLSTEELAWVNSHDTLKIGYMDDYLPFSDKTETGEPDGIVKDIVPLLLKSIHLDAQLKLDYTGYLDNDAMFEALRRGEIDAIFPVYDNIEYGVRNYASITTSVIDLSADLVYAGEYTDQSTKTIAVNRSNALQEYYTKTNYPDAKIIYYNSIDDALTAVKNGDAGSTILNSLRTTDLLSDKSYKNLTAVRLVQPFSFSFAVREGNCALLSIFNRAIANRGTSFAYDYAYTYIGAVDVSLGRFVRDNIWTIIGIFLIILAILGYLAISLHKSNKNLAETRFVNDKLLEKFDAIYIADLDHDTITAEESSKISKVGSFDGVRSFRQMTKQFADTVAPEYKQDWINFGDAEFMKQYMADQDTREFVYELPGVDKPLRRLTIDVLERDGGKPSKILLSFVGIDDISAKNIILQGQVAERNRLLETKQAQLEEALSMAQSANRAKTTFLNNMSHDIRTPMNAIIGFTGLAASHIDNKEQVQDYLSKIGQSSDHLLSLINDVLDMSRIESGKMNLCEKEENLSDIIHTLRDIVQADVRSKQLELFVDAVDVNDEDIFCDKLRLNQVLLNILSNAIKFTAPGGLVSLRVTEKAVKQNGYATYEFRIRDSGMGMDKEFLKTIFEPFTRMKSSTVSGIQGTGLGMAITKNIVDMMGGTIEIESEPGKGTEVTVTFDFRLQNAPKEPVEIPELKGVRALVADDDSNTCISICAMVEDIGMRGEWCTSGKEAVIRADVAHARGAAFRVYIIDWLMPDMNGIETTRRIRKVIGDDAPIIILTAYDWSDIEDEAKEAGVTAFVSKPMFPSDLHRVLNSCLGKTEETKPEKEVSCDFTGKKLLLVEDNDINREIATELLSEMGFLVDTAEDGDIAVEKMKVAQPGDYDLVLMDIQMPRMDGYEATRQIRALGTEISQIPILAMTANAFEEDRVLALDAGMNEHIAKPINPTKLKETLTNFLI